MIRLAGEVFTQVSFKLGVLFWALLVYNLHVFVIVVRHVVWKRQWLFFTHRHVQDCVILML